MTFYEGSKEQARLGALVAAQERAKAKAGKRGKKDKWGLRPIGKGWLRGHAMNIRIWEEADEVGMVRVMQFELRENPKEPGVPVRMTATEFNRNMGEGELMDVRDPDPSVRPITPYQIFFSRADRRDGDLTAHYPGRGMMAPRRNLAMGLLVIGAPIVFLLAAVAVLYYVFHVTG